MRTWEERSIEEANLLNPSFIGIVCYQTIKGYCDTTKKGAPYLLPFIVTPLVLHKRTRLSLPSRVSAHFATWTLSKEGTQAKARYPEHAKALNPSVKESLSLAIRHNILSITAHGEIVLGENTVQDYTKKSQDFTDEVTDCFKKATFCGRWIARAGAIETTMVLLGVKL